MDPAGGGCDDMTMDALPRATYRLQFNRDFNFDDANHIIPYLDMLGISHIYASPYLKARAGSAHGYDIVDHNAINPEIGDQDSFHVYIESLHRHHMGQILDIVPNHMGVGGDDNTWWLDVLENGEASLYTNYFDIDWHPVNPHLHNKILLPFLGDHYGSVLERGELKLGIDPDRGTFGVRYYEHYFPLDPRTYPRLLSFRLDYLSQQAEVDHQAIDELTSLIEHCRSMPRRTELSAVYRQQRYDMSTACKLRLSALCHQYPLLLAFLQENVSVFNGTPERPGSFDHLHRLLEHQAYRLAYWLVASDEINYRRFFDINELAGLRVENQDVFEITHRLIGDMIGNGKVDGLRIDHPDGLSDPYGYYCNLCRLIGNALNRDTSGNADDHAGKEFYIIVEKILASYERLPEDWPVAGTTGYETAHLLNGLFVYPDSESRLTRLYTRFTGRDTDFDELLYERKKFIIHNTLSSELTVLANQLSGIAQSDRRTRDFTYHGLREAITEIVACFPVYRTYITSDRISDEDRRYVQWAIAQAKKRRTASDTHIFDFVHQTLMLVRLNGYSANIRRRIIQFTLRFQQYTAPVMAKGLEDTSFYIYNRLVSLNDVGFDPRSFGISSNAFHQVNRQRLLDWPHAIVTTSTHDSKRSEDVRVRINVLSEVADDWRMHLARWRRINRSRKRQLDGRHAPSSNDEYLLYQILVGSWPLEPLDAEGLVAFCERIEAYMLKAVREAKMDTSWINPNEDYEEAVRHFVHALVKDPERNAFLADFIPFQKRIARFGLLNSLSQTLLKMTIPGIPDIYQGNELWAFELVDPDNRSPVDYQQCRDFLQNIIQKTSNSNELNQIVQDFVEHIEDGVAKLYLIWKTLTLRRRLPRLFADGDYAGLETRGQQADHVCAFARYLEGKEIIVVTTRWFARLLAGTDKLWPESSDWGDTTIELTDSVQAESYSDVLTDTRYYPVKEGDARFFRAADLLAAFPMALLSSE